MANTIPVGSRVYVVDRPEWVGTVADVLDGSVYVRWDDTANLPCWVADEAVEYYTRPENGADMRPCLACGKPCEWTGGKTPYCDCYCEESAAEVTRG